MYAKPHGRGAQRFAAFHGWGGTHREYAAVGARCPSDACLHAFDLPGYGRSPPPAEWSAAGIGRAMAAALLERGPAPWTLTGYCSGGAVALWTARALPPGAVERIVWIDPLDRVPRTLRLFTWGAFGRHAFDAAFHTPAVRALINGILRRRQHTAADFTAAFDRLDTARVLEWMRLFRDSERDLFSPPFEGSLELLTGRHTLGAVRAAVSRLRRRPRITTTVLPASGHLLMVEAAEAIARALWPADPISRIGPIGQMSTTPLHSG
jgi:pimeloyl-ACP methyl ester carboxylesterase